MPQSQVAALRFDLLQLATDLNESAARNDMQVLKHARRIRSDVKRPC